MLPCIDLSGRSRFASGRPLNSRDDPDLHRDDPNNCRDDKIRTCDPQTPSLVRYRTALRPEILYSKEYLLAIKVRLFSIFQYQKQPLSSLLNETTH